jgi:4-amino-4-deoxy-L-arabinose transferase-like glycosyltransferase
MDRQLLLRRYFPIFFVALFFSLVLNTFNVGYIRANMPDHSSVLVHGATINNWDNYWYLNQTKNYFAGKGFQVEADNIYSSVRRTPGYPLFYFVHVYLFGTTNAHYVIRFTQVFLFALSALLLALSVKRLTKNDQIALLSGYLYALSPFVAGWNYFTITESIHPAFVVFSLYFFTRALHKQSIGSFILTGIVLGMTTLIRPTNGLLLPAMLLALLVGYPGVNLIVRMKWLVRSGFFMGVGFLAILLPWTIRNYMATKDIVLLEKYYHQDAMSFGTSERYLMKWLSAWGNQSQTEIIHDLVSDTLKSPQAIEQLLTTFPERAFNGNSRQSVAQAFYVFNDCIKHKVQNNIWEKTYKPYEQQPACEQEAAAAFKVLTARFKKAAPVDYYLVTPIFRKGKEFVFHSFSTQLSMLQPVSGSLTWWQIGAKGMMFLLNLLLWVSLGILFTSFFPLHLRVLIGFITVCSFLLFVYIATVEGRYMLVAYPFLYITLSGVLIKAASTVTYRFGRYRHSFGLKQ